jgi:sugar O-acyltransferase (sialic acid O-acetyltransferase NeuD family)
MKDIAIVGAGGLGREVLVLLHQINEETPTWNILGFYDDAPALLGQYINGFPCLGAVSAIPDTSDELHIVLAIGNPVVKKKVLHQLQNHHLKFATLVHPLAQPRPYQHIEFGEGTLVFQGVVLTANIRIGHHVLVYLNCTVGHDAVLEDFVSLMPGVNVAGNTVLAEGVFMGSNAAILQGLQVGQGSQIGAGAVVTKSIPEGCTAVGVPAQIIKRYAL